MYLQPYGHPLGRQAMQRWHGLLRRQGDCLPWQVLSQGKGEDTRLWQGCCSWSSLQNSVTFCSVASQAQNMECMSKHPGAVKRPNTQS
jgi:hypothetical protein